MTNRQIAISALQTSGAADPLNRSRARTATRAAGKGYRAIDAEAAWKGELRGLRGFKAAFEIDCGGDVSLFLSVYRWTQDAFDTAYSRIIA